MKRMYRLSVLFLGLIASFASHADQFALPYGWTGGNGSSGQCLVSNGSVLLPSFQSCTVGGGAVTSVAETVPGFLAITGSPITSSGTLAITGATGQTTHRVVGTSTTGTVALFALTTADLPTLAAGSNGLATSATTDTTNAANISSGTLPAGRLPALTGDVTSTVGTAATTVAKVNGNTPGGTCTNQAVTSLSSSAVPTCTTLTSAYVDTSIALTGTDINTSNQVTATHLSAALPATQGGTGQTSYTLGDLLYSSASNVLSKLAGNTTTTKKFLTQTGDGTNSVAPGWSTIAAADLANLGPSLGDTTVTNLNVNGTNIPTIGLSKSGGGSLLFNTAGVTRGAFSSGTGGIFSTNGGIVSAGTKFTAAGTGCTVGTTVGGATAGTFTLAAGPCTSVAITMNGATGVASTNGWSCQAHDRTAPTVLIGGESSSTTTTATITIPAGAGTTDVISFSCMGY